MTRQKDAAKEEEGENISNNENYLTVLISALVVLLLTVSALMETVRLELLDPTGLVRTKLFSFLVGKRIRH